jgi:hypothetical protein
MSLTDFVQSVAASLVAVILCKIAKAVYPILRRLFSVLAIYLRKSSSLLKAAKAFFSMAFIFLATYTKKAMISFMSVYISSLDYISSVFLRLRRDNNTNDVSLQRIVSEVRQRLLESNSELVVEFPDQFGNSYFV